MAINNIFASYDANKVEQVLSSVTDNERKTYFEDMGITLENCRTLESALALSGLDFEVRKLPIYHHGLNGEYDFHQISDQFATVRSDTGATFGIVGKGYQILPNREAFEFLDSLVAMSGATFQSAGNFKKNGSASYIQMKTDGLDILGDEFENYILISNGFDGTSAVTVVITPIRAWCRNSALLALRNASCKVSVKHTINMHDNLERAKEVLLANTRYLEALKEEAEKLAVKTFSKEAFEAMAKKLFPVKEDASEVVQIRNLFQIEQLLKAYQEDDLSNFTGTAWGAIQAVADLESHKPIFRKSSKLADNGTPAFQSVIINGMPLLNQAYAMIQETV